MRCFDATAAAVAIVCVTHSMYNVNVRRHCCCCCCRRCCCCCRRSRSYGWCWYIRRCCLQPSSPALCGYVSTYSWAKWTNVQNVYRTPYSLTVHESNFLFAYLLFLCHLHHLYNNTSLVLFTSFLFVVRKFRFLLFSLWVLITWPLFCYSFPLSFFAVYARKKLCMRR